MGNCINSSMSNTVFHPQLGHLQKEYKENQRMEYLKANQKLVSKQKYERWQCQVRRLRYNPQTKDLLYIPQKIILKQSDLFQTQPTLQIFYSPYIQTLSDLITRYRSKQQHPSQQMIWYLIYSFAKVGKYFEKIECKIGSINLENVVISADREIRIICQKSTLEFIDPLDEVRCHLSDSVLLAPQQVQMLTTGATETIQQQVNPHISEVFSIGILVLSVANLSQPYHIYNYHHPSNPNSPTIDFTQITNLLSQMKKTKRYSDLLIQTICEMIEARPEKRIRSTQLFKRLSQYQYEIVSKKGLCYSGEEIEMIKESVNGSVVSRMGNNSLLSQGGNKSAQYHTALSLGVSRVSSTGDNNNGKLGQTHSSYQNLHNLPIKTQFVNIL